LPIARGRVAQLAITWVAAQGIDFVPLVGAHRDERLAEALGALTFALDAEDLADIESAVPKGAAACDRYAHPLLSELGSEKRPS
jgi:aryl-alcohol dehydrogenase-like predicted oxidoreductase